ncbi:hypothetical protein BYT27DRAFT_7190770 [Phlegmacium glaucopus]|nr:hypothetical protein BYT27DRAFT_7190770 [Phlegmacium glaucopus]
MTEFTRRPLSVQSSELLLTPLLCYYVTAILVTLPRTSLIRLAILPITLFFAFRASTQLDLAAGYGDDGRLAYLNQALLLAMTILAIRAIIWTFQRNPYRRTHRSSDVSLTYSQILLDGLDLSLNLRGIGWSWSCLPKPPTESRSSFTFFLHNLASFLFHVVFFDVVHRLVQIFEPNTIGSPVGGSIFDPSLPPLYRYSRSTLITLFAGFTIYAAIQAAYLFLTLFSLIFLRHSPSQWPPIFNHPWFSTSLSQFWSRRWHQLFRDVFVSFGGNTLTFFMGRVGGVLGAFFISGLLHTFGLWGMGRGGEFIKVTGFFMLMAVGTLLEHSWKSLTGSRVDGFLGRVWTLVWLLGWGNLLVEAWSTKGLVGSVFFPDGYRPSDYILQWWIKS